MKKILIAILITLLFRSFSFAQEATDSSLTDKIKERLEKTAEEGLDKIKEEVISKTNNPRPKAYVGLVKNINEDSLTLEYKSQTYPVASDVRISAQEGDYLLVLGFFYPEKNQFRAKKILLIDAPQPPINRQLLSGQIEEVDGNKVKVGGKILTVSSKTSFKIKDVNQPTTEDLQIKDYVFAIVVMDKNGQIAEVKAVFVLPGKNNPAASAPTNASDSATIKEWTSFIRAF